MRIRDHRTGDARVPARSPRFVGAALAATLGIVPAIVLLPALPASAAGGCAEPTVDQSSWSTSGSYTPTGDLYLGGDITTSIPLEIEGTRTLDLCGHALTISGVATNHAAVHVTAGNALTIEATGGGALTADAGYHSAGIGAQHNGGWPDDSGAITINGGTVHAIGRGGAGIGSALGGYVDGVLMRSDVLGDITINGGTVTATAVGDSALGTNPTGSGIGGGWSAPFIGHIRITGGIVTASSQQSGAGIGGDAMEGSIEITGGTVVASSASNGPGIGASAYDLSGSVVIGGGTVTASGGPFQAGIGAWGDLSGAVEISGGVVTANGGANGPGIGGFDDASGTITVSGGAVTANGDGAAAGIGGGQGGSFTGALHVSGGIVTATVRGWMSAATIGSGWESTYAPEGLSASDALIEGAELTSTGAWSADAPSYAGAYPSTLRSTAPAPFDGSVPRFRAQLSAQTAVIAFVSEVEFDAVPARIAPGDVAILTAQAHDEHGEDLGAVSALLDVTSDDPSDSITGNRVGFGGEGLRTITAAYGGQRRDYQVEVSGTGGGGGPASCAAPNASASSWPASGGFAPTEDVYLGGTVMTTIPLRIDGARLIDLCGYRLIIAGVASGAAAVEVPDGAHLTVAATGGGRLTATGGQYAAGIGGDAGENSGSVTIASGIVTATGGQYGAGIGGGDGAGFAGTLELLGGSLQASGGDNAAGIGGARAGTGFTGGVVVTGGSVLARGGDWAAGIGDSYQGAGSTGDIEIAGGTVQAAGGQYAAGIGGGALQDFAGSLAIGGGRVRATGGDWAAGIGGGYATGSSGGTISGTVRISGGITTAESGSHGAANLGAGYGYRGTGGTVALDGAELTSDAVWSAAAGGPGDSALQATLASTASAPFSGSTPRFAAMTGATRTVIAYVADVAFTPPAASVELGATFALHGSAVDASGDPLGDVSAVLAVTSDGAGDTVSGNSVTTGGTGPRIISVGYAGRVAAFTVHAVDTVPVGLRIANAPTGSVQLGTTVALQVFTVNAGGEDLVDVSDQVGVTSDRGDAVHGERITVTSLGEHVLTVALGALPSVQATIHVVDTVPVALAVLAPPDTATVGDTIVVRAWTENSGGEGLEDVSSQVTLTSDQGDAIVGNRVTFVHASPHTITATLGALQTSFVVEVAPAPAPLTGTGRGLASTGSSPLLWALGAAATLLLGAIGAGLGAAARRR